VGKKIGPYLGALVERMRAAPRRKKPHPQLALLLEAKMPPDLRAFLSAWSEHDPGFIAVGEYWLESSDLGGRVPDAEDADRDDVICVGHSPGGDLYVVDRPPLRGQATHVSRLAHDEGFSGVGGGHLDELLRDCVERQHEDGRATDLDAALAALVPGARPRSKRVGDAKLDLAAVCDARQPGGKPNLGKWKARLGALEPIRSDISPTWGKSSSGAFAAVMTEDGVHVLGASGAPRRICALGDEAACVAVAGELVFVLRRTKRKLEVYTAEGERKAAIASKKLDHMITLAGGRALVLASFYPSGGRESYVLGVRGEELRLLGKFALNLHLGWDERDRAVVKDSSCNYYALRDLADALETAFAEKARAIKL
jgi:hypothetical protein